jgi:tRNA(Ile)-lysidine synthase
MKVNILPGRYVLGVSGGVDSMVLLDLLAKEPGIELIVAHLDHGIRQDSNIDERLVMKAAGAYGFKYRSGKAALGANASEDAARRARYDFLERIRDEHNAIAIITAHHQDDKIETALINLLRGTGRQGLSAISNNQKVLRPLLDISKKAILSYALKNRVEWREDSTNNNPDYLRNYLRLRVLLNLGTAQRKILISNIDKVAKTNKNINEIIATLSHNVNQSNLVNRRLFAALPDDVGRELVVYWLRNSTKTEFDKKTVHRLAMAIKTGKAGTKHPIKQHDIMQLSDKSALFSNTLGERPVRLV